jgi:hypothetical protein
MVWALLKNVAKEVLRLRTVVLAVGVATAGGAAMFGLGVLLVGGALKGSEWATHFRSTILFGAGLVYAVCGALTAAQMVLIHAMRRAIENMRPAVRPLVERVTAGMIQEFPQSSSGIEIAAIESELDGVFDTLARSVDVPVLRRFFAMAAALGRWRLRREFAPHLDALRRQGATHITAETLRNYLNHAGCEALIAPLTDQLSRSRLIIWLLPVVLLLIPAVVWAYRAAH